MQKRTKDVPKMTGNEGSRQESVHERMKSSGSDLSKKNKKQNIKITDYLLCEGTEEIYTVRVWG